MKTITERIRERLEKDLPRRRSSLNELRAAQWSSDFERLMRNRLIMGAMRYETFSDKKQHNSYDVIGTIEKRIVLYRQTGNLEHLVDVANYCMIEFESPSHPNPTWESVDDGVHAEKRK